MSDASAVPNAPTAAPAPAAGAPAETPTADAGGTMEERLAALKAAPDAPAVEGGKPAPAAAAPDAPATEDEVAKAREDRAKRLAELQAKERARVAKGEARKQKPAPEPPAELAQLRAELERERQKTKEYDDALSTAEGFVSLAEKKNIDPLALGTHIRDRIANPERIAALEAKRQLTPLEQKLLGELQARDKRIEAIEHEIQASRVAVVETHAANQLVSHVTENARVAPLSARYIQRHGQEAFLHLARSVAQYLPDNSGLQAVHDTVEQTLENMQLGGAEPPQPSKPTPANRAAAKAPTTVSNSLASQRTAVADEEAEFAKLPFEERVKILKQRNA